MSPSMPQDAIELNSSANVVSFVAVKLPIIFPSRSLTFNTLPFAAIKSLNLLSFVATSVISYRLSSPVVLVPYVLVVVTVLYVIFTPKASAKLPSTYPSKSWMNVTLPSLMSPSIPQDAIELNSSANVVSFVAVNEPIIFPSRSLTFNTLPFAAIKSESLLSFVATSVILYRFSSPVVEVP